MYLKVRSGSKDDNKTVSYQSRKDTHTSIHPRREHDSYLFSQTIQTLRQTIHTSPIRPTPTPRPKTPTSIRPHPIMILLPLPIKLFTRTNIIHPSPNTQIQRSTIKSIHLFQFLSRYRQCIFGIDVVLDFDRVFYAEHDGNYGVFVVVETGAGLGTGEVAEEFHEDHVVVYTCEEDSGYAYGRGEPYWDWHGVFILFCYLFVVEYI
mmetsp:Transcript_10471/g.16872  ORF Transcript_10471/g.16872 Transcript_10471/m.16872 type:complete len:206 (+) Transcript_10471:635-1252(+)